MTAGGGIIERSEAEFHRGGRSRSIDIVDNICKDLLYVTDNICTMDVASPPPSPASHEYYLEQVKMRKTWMSMTENNTSVSLVDSLVWNAKVYMFNKRTGMRAGMSEWMRVRWRSECSRARGRSMGSPFRPPPFVPTVPLAVRPRVESQARRGACEGAPTVRPRRYMESRGKAIPCGIRALTAIRKPPQDIT
jgi:hypothetical protein